MGDHIRAPPDVVRSLPPLYQAVLAVLVRSGKAEIVADSAPRPGKA